MTNSTLTPCRRFALALFLSTELKMAATRLDVDSNKKSALMKESMRAVANLLAESKDDMARVRTEALIRDDHLLLAYEILKAECQILVERVPELDHCNANEAPPPHLASLVADVIFAAPRLQIAELSQARKQFRVKFGKPFKTRAMENENGILNEKLVHYLSLEQPLTAATVDLYIEKICRQYNVAWTPPPIVQVPVHDVVVLEPAVTGLEHVDGQDGKGSSTTIKNHTSKSGNKWFTSMPFAPRGKGTSLSSDTLSKSSHSGNDDDDDNHAPCAPPCVMATPL